jgi:lysophospholipase L1-like esterase
MQKTACGVSIALVVSVAALLEPGVAARQQGTVAAPRWITAWATSQQALAPAAVSNTTVRMVARVTVSGQAVRIRLDNTFGTTPLTIGRALVGHRIQGAALAAGSNRPVMFNGSARVIVPPRGTVTSDPVPLQVLARQDLAVSLYIPDAEVRPSQHGGAQVTSYVAANGSGDVAGEEAATPFTGTTTSMWWLKGIDVAAPLSTGAIVAFGDSITDGTCTTVDAHDRWQDLLAVRLALDAARIGRRDAHKAVINEGIGGNTLTRENLQPAPDSPPAVERLDRDVLSHSGVTHVVLFMGTNDIRREAPAAQVIAGMSDIATRVKARGLRIVGATIIPRHNRAPAENNTGWNDAKTRIRQEVNHWIRTRAPFDGVLEFDEVVKDPQNADLIAPPFNCGDGVHPSPRGYYEMGAAVRLELFR